MIWVIVCGALVIGLMALAWVGLIRSRRAEAAHPPLGQWITVEGTRLHYVRKGSGPPLVLLHGSDGFLQDYTTTVLERLAAEYDVLAWDRPGHGYSAPPAHAVATPQVQARLLHGMLQQLDIRKPLLVGHSWGGLLALLYALEYPDDVSGLVLIAPWVYAPRTPPSPLLYLPLVPLLGDLIVTALMTLLKTPLIRTNLAEAFAPDPVPEAYARMAQALWLRHPRQTKVFARENTADRQVMRALADRYSDLRIPLVIVAGEADRAVPPAQHAERLHHAVLSSELYMLPRSGHELLHTRPDAVLDAIARCRARVTEPASVATASPAEPRATPDPIPARARELVFRYGWNATAYQILNPEMERWFSAAGDAVVGFVRRKGVRITAGAPVCERDRLAEVAAEFERDAGEAGERVCYFGAAARLRSLLQELPSHSTLVIGAQPVWNPAHWSDILKRHASLRAQLNRARNKGVGVAEWPATRAHRNPDLQRCLEEWMATRGLPTLHFLTEPVGLDRLADRRLFVAEQAGVPVGFLIATPVPDRNGWLLEQIVRGRAAPNGTAELLVDAALCTFAEEQADYVTLGLAPLSRRAGVPDERPFPGLRLVLAWIRAHGRRFYNFDGLDAFKAKFRPDAWEPLFAISNEAVFSPRTLYAIAAAFTSGPPLRAITHALSAAVRQELIWLRDRKQHSSAPPRS
ncbi:MAG TPA: alpha/beta fold hydrolase [Chthonomonadaceae bacterium]|nr:alpha/beta fold hydrolase [Chthonomonadaceae bacterium]